MRNYLLFLYWQFVPYLMSMSKMISCSMESCMAKCEAVDGKVGSSQVAGLNAVQLALDITEWEKWPALYLCTDSRTVANASVGMAGMMEKRQLAAQRETHLGFWILARHLCLGRGVAVKVCAVDAHAPKSQACEEYWKSRQVDELLRLKFSGGSGLATIIASGSVGP